MQIVENQEKITEQNFTHQLEFSLAMTIVAALVRQGLIAINDQGGFEAVQVATITVTRCLSGLGEIDHEKFVDFVVSK